MGWKGNGMGWDGRDVNIEDVCRLSISIPIERESQYDNYWKRRRGLTRGRETGA